ncbi:MAG: FtsX-like permease family protein [Luteitalea sp.]|nr:FtsX-like permease family protein [Luteitalea sp.]
MKLLPLVWRCFTRRKLRTVFTALSVFVAFLLFGLLMAARSAFSYGAELSGTDRLMMFQKVSFSRPLPLSYEAQIAATPGVALVTHATWFSAVYQDSKQRFVQLAVDAERFLEMHPQYLLAHDQRQAWLANRTGCIVGRDLATRFGWNVGDQIPLRGLSSWRMADDSHWAFTIDGIYDGRTMGADLNQMFVHYDYVNDARAVNRDHVGWYLIRVAQPKQAADVAARLDDRFANSANETKTATEKAFLQAWASQIGDIGRITLAISGTVLFTILLITGNTMAQSIRERTSELAILKVLGFTDARILGLVLVESLLLTAIAGWLALVLAWLIVHHATPSGGLLPTFSLSGRDFTIGSGLAVVLGLLAGALPALQAGRLKIVDALRH